MKTFHAFCEHPYSIDKRPSPSGYKWTKKYVSCVPSGSRWKIYGARWGGVGYGRDESEDSKNGNGKANGSNGNGHSNGSSGNGNGGNGNGGSGGGNGGGGE